MSLMIKANEMGLPLPELTTPKLYEELPLSSKNLQLPSLQSLFPLEYISSYYIASGPLLQNSACHDQYSTSLRSCNWMRSSSISSQGSDIPPSVKGKRKRASIQQIDYLNLVFSKTFFPSTELRKRLGRMLGMEPRAVQIWFQNKRQATKVRFGSNVEHYKEPKDENEAFYRY